MTSARRVDFKTMTDGRGNLTIVESELPFSIQRVYYLHSVPSGQQRGAHAHKELEQIAIAVHGSLEITLDNGKSTEKFLMDDPTKGLYIPKLVWRTLQNFSKDAVLLVLASLKYSEEDYFRNHDDFLEFLNA
jgi:dTDP-4-dehydrorhamnose 3,5-epimerase-like enzyme